MWLEKEKKIQEYEEAFDFYIDNGRLPENISSDDLLGNIIKTALTDNLQQDSQDEMWRELLKEEIIKFLKVMLNLFCPFENHYEHEMTLINTFSNSDIDQKRNMWRDVYNTIKREYKAEEVNIDGYVDQMKHQDLDAVFASLLKDWEKACDIHLRKRKLEVVELQQKAWNQKLIKNLKADFKQMKYDEDAFFYYPQLAEIVKIMGREKNLQEEQKEEYDETIRNYLPLLPSPPHSAEDIEQVSVGNDMQHMLPIEMTILSDRETEDLFYIKYASNQLQLFANKLKQENVLKTEIKHRTKPRKEKGPIIVSLDTSGSMIGRSEQIARSLLLQLLKMAKQQKRKCLVITFSVRAEFLDLTQSGSWGRLKKFLNNPYTGGTDGEEMLRIILKKLNSDNFSMADVLIISDFYFAKPLDSTQARMRTEQVKGTRFYGLQIDSTVDSYIDVLDRIWKVKQ